MGGKRYPEDDFESRLRGSTSKGSENGSFPTRPFVSVCLAVCVLLGVPIYSPRAASVETFNLQTGVGSLPAVHYTWQDPVLTITDGADIELTGTTSAASGRFVRVLGSAKITLNSVNYTGPTGDDCSPITIMPGADATIVMIGTSTLQASGINAGIRVDERSALTITGTGVLNAKGGPGQRLDFNGAGIGGIAPKNGGSNCGRITISSGTVNATGGNNSAGIGSGGSKDSSNAPPFSGSITITGTAVVNAACEQYGAGIGSGRNSPNNGSITINGNAVVDAKVKKYGAGIGGGYGSTAGTLIIGGETRVTAQGGTSSSGIGGGDKGDGGYIWIGGKAVVTATGGDGEGTPSSNTDGAGAGIGGGERYQQEGGNSGDITITGEAVVTATGGANPVGDGGAGIGSGGGATYNGSDDKPGNIGKIIIDSTRATTATGGGGLKKGAAIGSGGGLVTGGEELFGAAYIDPPTIGLSEARGYSADVSFAPGAARATYFMIESSPGGKKAVGFASPVNVGGLTPGVDYRFAARAVKTASQSSYTSVYSAFTNTVIPYAVPLAPTNLLAVFGDGKADIAWDAPTYDGGNAITKYEISYSPTMLYTDNFSVINPLDLGGPSAVIDNLINGVDYTIKIRAVNDAGGGEAAIARGVPKARELTPAAEIDYMGESFYGLSNGSYIVSIGGNDTHAVVTSGLMPILESWIGNTVDIIKESSGAAFINSLPQTIGLPGRPNAPSAAKTDIVFQGDDDGTITGDETMEYLKDGGVFWADMPGGLAGGLSAGVYHVRNKANSAAFYSSEQLIIINEGDVKTWGIQLDINGGYSFSDLTYGYLATPKAVTITSAGNQSTGELEISIGGANGDAFFVSPDTIADIAPNPAAAGFTISPKDGLNAGVYKATVTVRPRDPAFPMTQRSFDIDFKVNKANQTQPIYNEGNSRVAKTIGDAPFSFFVSGGEGGGAYVYSTDDPHVAEIDGGGTVRPKGEGVTVLSVYKDGDENYNASGSVSITLRITPPVYTVGAIAGAGGVIGGALPAPPFFEGSDTQEGAWPAFFAKTDVSVFAYADSGYSFDSWAVKGLDAAAFSDKQNPIAFAMPQNDVEVVAAFKKNVYTVESVIVSKDGIDVSAGASQRFSATIRGANNPPLGALWSIESPHEPDTVISGDGTLFVSASETRSSLVIRARATADPHVFGEATVNVSGVLSAATFNCIALNIGGLYTFPQLKFPYTQTSQFVAVITNVGNAPTGEISIKASSAFAASPGAVALGVGESAEITITPTLGLLAGDYYSAVNISGANGLRAAFDVRVSVAPPETFLLSVVGSGAAKSGAGAYAECEVINIDAGNKIDSVFSGWKAPADVLVANKSLRKTTITMPNKDVSIEALWAKDEDAIKDFGNVNPFRPVTITAPAAKPPEGKNGSKYYDDIEFGFARGLYKGFEDNEFKADIAATRAMATTVIWRFAGQPKADSGGAFADVSPGAYYAEAVLWARSIGLVKGVGANMFAPDSQLTRQDLDATLYNYCSYAKKKLPPVRAMVRATDEADVSEYAKKAIEEFNKANIMPEGDAREIKPRAAISRGEAAHIIRRFIEAIGQ